MSHSHRMPKRFVARPAMRYDMGMETRVAVLEQIAKDGRDMMARLETKIDAGFKDLRNEIKDVRSEINVIRMDQKSDYRWLLGLMFAQFATLTGMIGGLAGLIQDHLVLTKLEHNAVAVGC